MKKIGILGGTFDPIHNGHLFLAQLVLSEFNLDEIMFLPLYYPPHKSKPMASPNLRLKLVEKAIAGRAGFCVSDMELKRKGVTYTIDSLKELHKKEPAEYFFIVGSDTLPEMESWKEAEQIFKLCTVICILRPGAKTIQNVLEDFRLKFGANILTLEVVGKDISSTEVRERIQKGEEFSKIVPEEIYDDIKANYIKEKIVD